MPLVRVEDRGPVRHVVLDRPEERNAINRDMVAELGEAVSDAAGAGGVRVVVLCGAGEVFSAGIDPAELSSIRDSHATAVETCNRLEELAKPTVCQIQGACLGRALQLALACDLRVMAEDALVGLPETRIGLIPAVGGCSRLPSVVGLGRAKELVMTGRAIDGHEAYAIGLANRIAPREKLDEETRQLCDELLLCAPLALGSSKRVLDVAAKPALAATLEREADAQASLARSEDFAEGAQAVAEGRAPEFGRR